MDDAEPWSAASPSAAWRAASTLAGDRERRARAAGGEVLALEPLERDARPAVFVGPVRDVADDVRARGRGEDLGLALEPLDRGEVRLAIEQPLHRDGRAGHPIDRAIDLTERAPADPRLELESPAEGKLLKAEHPEGSVASSVRERSERNGRCAQRSGDRSGGGTQRNSWSGFSPMRSLGSTGYRETTLKLSSWVTTSISP